MMMNNGAKNQSAIMDFQDLSQGYEWYSGSRCYFNSWTEKPKITLFWLVEEIDMSLGFGVIPKFTVILGMD